MNSQPPSYDEATNQNSYERPAAPQPSDSQYNRPHLEAPQQQNQNQQHNQQNQSYQGHSDLNAPPLWAESNPGKANEAGYGSDGKYPPEKQDGHQIGANQPTQDNYGPRYGTGPGQNGGPVGPPPNVTYVPPQKVNITLANPQHLDPAYPQFLQRQQERNQQGHVDPPHKHGAPLNPGHTGKSLGAFPGSSGATYFNAANK